jgi:hypothetical protein
MKAILGRETLCFGQCWDSFAGVTRVNLGGEIIRVTAERGFHLAQWRN